MKQINSVNTDINHSILSCCQRSLTDSGH